MTFHHWIVTKPLLPTGKAPDLNSKYLDQAKSSLDPTKHHAQLYYGILRSPDKFRVKRSSFDIFAPCIFQSRQYFVLVNPAIPELLLMRKIHDS